MNVTDFLREMIGSSALTQTGSHGSIVKIEPKPVMIIGTNNLIYLRFLTGYSDNCVYVSSKGLFTSKEEVFPFFEGEFIESTAIEKIIELIRIDSKNNQFLSNKEVHHE